MKLVGWESYQCYCNQQGVKINRFGQGEILKPNEISLLFKEGFVNERDRALFGICLYAGARINEACTILKGDVISPRGVRPKLMIRSYNAKGGRDTREIQIHPTLKEYLEAYYPTIHARGKNLHLFPGRHGLNHIQTSSADRLLRNALQRVGLEEGGFSTHSFRRTCLTMMSDANIPLRHIQSISGHRSLGALERYLGVSDEHKESAIAALNFEAASPPF